MADNKPGGLKLKLRKADTNRLKTQTGRLKTQGAEDASEAQTKAVPVPPQPPAAEPPPSQTGEIRDPMALRDTSHGKLKRVQSPDETASAVAPASEGEHGVKRETVRLKVVRDKKKGGPQILPPTPGTPPPAPPPPSPTEAVPPSAQTVKISLPGLKKPGASAASTKHATATVRVQEPPEGAGGTLKISPPDAEGGNGEYRETSTSTLKLTPKKPGEAAEAPDANAGRTVKITPAADAAKSEEQSAPQNKQVTATLKIRSASDAAPPEPKPAASEPTSKNVTATLKIRSGGKGDDTSSTVRMPPPQAEDKAGAETVISAPPAAEEKQPGKPSLRLRKPGKPADDASATVRLPGLDETPAAEDASETVALPTGEEMPPAEEPDGKKGLKLRTAGHAAEGAEDAGEEGTEETEPEAEAAAVLAPKPTSSGPGVFAFATTFAACGALGALVYRLVMDFLQNIK
jgi:hypothetical protein